MLKEKEENKLLKEIFLLELIILFRLLKLLLKLNLRS